MTVPIPMTARPAGAEHYARMTIQPWDAMAEWMTPEQYTGFLLGNCIKYLARFNCHAPGKGGLADLEKARHYLEKLEDLERRA